MWCLLTSFMGGILTLSKAGVPNPKSVQYSLLPWILFSWTEGGMQGLHHPALNNIAIDSAQWLQQSLRIPDWTHDWNSRINSQQTSHYDAINVAAAWKNI